MLFRSRVLLGLLFYRLALRDEQRQELVDLASARGLSLSDERARRAAAAGTTERLRARIEDRPRG